MLIEPFRKDDIGRFLELAALERWVAEAWEFDFLQDAFPEGCFAARNGSGVADGFVTSLRHERSGWIGNLIVAPEQRGRGIGEALFVRAFGALCEAGVETAWLTASRMGKTLYEKHGFASIDTIVRWTGKGRGLNGCRVSSGGAPDADMDQMGWGDRREELLKVTAGRGPVLATDGAFTIIQPCGSAAQFGPFAALNASHASMLLDDALGSIPAGTKVYIDIPAGNREVVRLLMHRGFERQGSNELMYAGSRPAYRPEYIYGLATMGSCG